MAISAHAEADAVQSVGVPIATDEDGWDEEETLLCAACNKRFKNIKQWENHERSKKHLERVKQLRLEISPWPPP